MKHYHIYVASYDGKTPWWADRAPRMLRQVGRAYRSRSSANAMAAKEEPDPRNRVVRACDRKDCLLRVPLIETESDTETLGLGEEA